MTEIICTYCGSDSDEIHREHVIPAAYFGVRTYDTSKQWIVPACKVCNSLAGARVYFSIPEKTGYLARRYRSKYRKILSVPLWSEVEIEELGYLLQVSIRSAMFARAVIGSRIRHLEAVENYDTGYMRPNWVKLEQEEWLKEQKQNAEKKKRPKKKLYG